MNIVIYSNCHGEVLKQMLLILSNELDIKNIKRYCNFEELDKNNKLNNNVLNDLKKCNLFIYQPFNKTHCNNEWDVNNLIKYLNTNALIFRINYYRFKGFHFNNEFHPFYNYDNYYKFNKLSKYGLDNNLKKYNGKSIDKLIEFINNIQYNSTDIINNFEKGLELFKVIDNCSDVNMYDFFINNYKKYRMFHDVYHPTNIFIYESLRQLVEKIFKIKLKYMDMDFINKFDSIEMTKFTTPIMPNIKKILDLDFNDIFYLWEAHKKIKINIYDYCYMRLNFDNFKKINNL